MTKNHCAYCYGKFGLVRYRRGFKSFCSTTCVDSHIARLRADVQKRKGWAQTAPSAPTGPIAPGADAPPYGMGWNWSSEGSDCAKRGQIRDRADRGALTILRNVALLGLVLATISTAMAQVGPSGPPAVGVVTTERRPITERTEITGRVQAPQRVALVARVTAFLDEQLFEEGTTVKQGELLYRLERPPFEADVESKQAAVAQAKAQLENADLALSRAEELFGKQVGSQVTRDNARASQGSAAAQVKSAEAQLRQSQINLDYTEIHSPIEGRIGRTSVTIGNVVGPTSGTLATVVSLDPMYVTFPMSVRRVLELRDRNASKGGFDAVSIRLRLPNGNIYDHVGKLDFLDINVAQDTDTIILRGVISNPVLSRAAGGDGRVRELTNDEFVTVFLESVEPTQVLAVPRAAVLSDQQGDYVFVVDADDVARQRRVSLGQSTAGMAAVVDGLSEGDRVVAEGIQRVKPNAKVAPAPVTGQVGSASPTPQRS